MKAVIATDRAPKAIGPYSQAVVVGETVYCSGQIGLDPATGALVSGGVEAETRQVLSNLTAVLEAADMTIGHVVQTVIYLTDMEHFTRVNALYGEVFSGDALPARVTVAVSALPKGALVEISCVAAK